MYMYCIVGFAHMHAVYVTSRAMEQVHTVYCGQNFITPLSCDLHWKKLYRKLLLNLLLSFFFFVRGLS